jgi:hypothetical protein
VHQFLFGELVLGNAHESKELHLCVSSLIDRKGNLILRNYFQLLFLTHALLHTRDNMVIKLERFRVLVLAKTLRNKHFLTPFDNLDEEISA